MSGTHGADTAMDNETFPKLDGIKAPRRHRHNFGFRWSGSRYFPQQQLGKRQLEKTRPKPREFKKKMVNQRLKDFFAQYTLFTFDSRKSAAKEFYRLCDTYGWEKNNEDRETAHEEYKNALVSQFNDNFGHDVTVLENWLQLLKEMGIKEVPESVTQAKKIIRGVYVNLVDLTDSRARPGVRVKMFKTLDQLRDYTMAEGKYFPKQAAHAGGLLKYLLREILAGSYHGGIKQRKKRQSGRGKSAR